MNFIAGSGSCFSKEKIIKGRFDSEMKFISNEITINVSYLKSEFWDELAKIAKLNEQYLMLYI